MLLENHQQLHHTLFGICIYQDNILLEKDLQKQLCHILLDYIPIKNRIKNKRHTLTALSHISWVIRNSEKNSLWKDKY